MGAVSAYLVVRNQHHPLRELALERSILTPLDLIPHCAVAGDTNDRRRAPLGKSCDDHAKVLLRPGHPCIVERLVHKVQGGADNLGAQDAVARREGVSQMQSFVGGCSFEAYTRTQTRNHAMKAHIRVKRRKPPKRTSPPGWGPVVSGPVGRESFSSRELILLSGDGWAGYRDRSWPVLEAG